MSAINKALAHNARYAPRDIPAGAIKAHSGLGKDPGSMAFYNATRAIQQALGQKVDGWYGQDTDAAVDAAYGRPMPDVLPAVEGRFDVPSASRTLLYGDFRIPATAEDRRKTVRVIEGMRPTHFVLGVNNVPTAMNTGAFRMMESAWTIDPDTKKGRPSDRLVAYADDVNDNCVFGVQVWMAANEAFIRAMIEPTVDVIEATHAGLCVPNAEGDWVEVKSGHSALSDLFYALLRKRIKERISWPVLILPAILYHLPAKVQRLLELADGMITEVLSFRRDSKPDTKLPQMQPGFLQMLGWDKYLALRSRFCEEFMVFWQLAAYDQGDYGVPPERAMLASACAALGRVRPELWDREGNLAWWSLHNAVKATFYPQVIASFSPRVMRPERAWRH